MTTIGLLGATGYTGRLTAAELERRGITHRLGGRNPDRLAAVPPGSHSETYVVDATDPDGLRGFMDGLDAVISCVGPFVQYGDPVVDAAVQAGVPYVDSTGEMDFITGVYERHREAGTVVVPACGFDYIPGDLATAIAAEELGVAAESMVVGYELHKAAITRGTAMSGAGMIASAAFAPTRHMVVFPEGPRSIIAIPWGETVTGPQHLGIDVVSGVVLPGPAARMLSAGKPLFRLTHPLVGLAQPLLEKAAARLPEGPPEAKRLATSFRIVAQATAGRRSARVIVEGHDPYGLTARFLVEAALSAKGAGACAPAQALDPRGFLDAVSGPDLRWRVL